MTRGHRTGIPTEPVGFLPPPAPPSFRPPTPPTMPGRSPRSSWNANRTKPSATRSSASRPPGRRLSQTASSAGRASPPIPSPTLWPGPASLANLAGGGQYFAIFADGHHRQLPRLTGGPFRYKTFAADTLKKSIAMAYQADEAGGDRALHARPPVPAGPGGSRLLPGSSSRKTCATSASRTSGRAFAAGAARVSVDFTEGRLATRNDLRNPWTGRNMLPHFIELNNRVIDRFTA